MQHWFVFVLSVVLSYVVVLVLGRGREGRMDALKGPVLLWTVQAVLVTQYTHGSALRVVTGSGW